MRIDFVKRDKKMDPRKQAWAIKDAMPNAKHIRWDDTTHTIYSREWRNDDEEVSDTVE